MGSSDQNFIKFCEGTKIGNNIWADLYAACAAADAYNTKIDKLVLRINAFLSYQEELNNRDY